MSKNIAEKFKSPPGEFRPVITYHPGKGQDIGSVEDLHNSRIQDGFSLELIKDLNFGGVVVNVKTGENYLRDAEEWIKLKKHVEKAGEYGLFAIIYDEDGFPSGDAGGLVLEGHPEFEALGLYQEQITVRQGETVNLKFPGVKPLYSKAFPFENGTADLSRALDIEFNDAEEITWKAPDDRDWLTMTFYEKPLFENTFAGSDWIKDARRYINIMDEKAVERFIKVTYEEYLKHLGHLFSNVVKGFFTDETSLMVYRDTKPPYTAVPWHNDMPDIFYKKYGYDLIPVLPLLYTDTGSESRKVRCDYYGLVAELCANSYFKQISDWCNDHGVYLTGHLLMEERLVWHNVMEGDAMKALSQFGVPGMDVLCSSPDFLYKPEKHFLYEAPPVGAKTATSASHHAGKNRTFCETSGFQDFIRGIKIGYDEYMGTFNWQLAMGINLFTVFCPSWSFTLDEWRFVNNYTGRVSYMLSLGSHVADIALFYPIKSIWANYIPNMSTSIGEGRDEQVLRAPWTTEKYSPEVKRIDDGFVELTNKLLQNQRDFDYIHEDTLENSDFNNGLISVANEQYKILLLPIMDTISRNAWNNVKEFIENGGTVICIEEPPKYTSEGEDIKAESSELFKRPASGEAFSVNRISGEGKTYTVASINDVIVALNHAASPDLWVSGQPDPDILYCHRRYNGMDIYFVANNSKDTKTLNIGFASEGKPQLWNPKNGEITDLKAAESADGKTVINLTLTCYDGQLIVFNNNK